MARGCEVHELHVAIRVYSERLILFALEGPSNL